MKILLLFCLLVAPSLGYKMFQDVLPNGGSVPHPCNPDYTWQGVGHLVQGGGGTRNPFGLDFYKNGKTWDRCLCETDSDGDGRTNGEELGDPECVWEPGTAPPRSTGLSHPGVCEPIDSPDCEARNVEFGDICQGSDGVNPCIQDILEQESDVKNWTLKLTHSAVPAQETTYVCQTYEFPDTTTDYHAVAYQPLIENANVMHHMLMYGCIDDKNVTSSPSECGMIDELCTELLFVWAVGLNGHCLINEFGFRIGKTGFKKILLQVHWNNPQLVDDYTDGSGMLMYFTPNLRQHDGGMLVIGQVFIEIPPGRMDVEVSGSCPGSCTTHFPWNVYVTDVMIHMHYLGYKGYMYHDRNGTTINDLVEQEVYNYDTPTFVTHEPALEVLPGDELRAVCHYKSQSREGYTFFGQATQAEMCFGFLTYYPRIPGMKGCYKYLSKDYCYGLPEDNQMFGCNETERLLKEDEVFANLSSVCDPTGETCSPRCRSLLEGWEETDPCLSGDHLKRLKKLYRQGYQGDTGKLWLSYLISCEEKADEENETKLPSDVTIVQTLGDLCPAEPPPDGATSSAISSILLLGAVVTVISGTSGI